MVDDKNKSVRFLDKYLDFSKFVGEEHPVLDPSRDSCSHSCPPPSPDHLKKAQQYLRQQLLKIAPENSKGG